MDGEWIDISVALENGMLVWDGDPSFGASAERIEPNCRITHLRLGSHTGTHLDAPRHVIEDGASLDDLDPRAINGPARVIDLTGLGPALTGTDLRARGAGQAERLLLKTDNGGLLDGAFDPGFTHLSLDAARWLAGRGTRLVGIDYLSVEAPGDPELPVHHTLLGADPPVWLLETLDLRQVEPGDYTLLCLPLRLAAGDAAPARAFLAASGPR